MSCVTRHLFEASQIIKQLDTRAIERVVGMVVDARARGGRLFILGVGGGSCLARRLRFPQDCWH